MSEEQPPLGSEPEPPGVAPPVSAGGDLDAGGSPEPAAGKTGGAIVPAPTPEPYPFWSYGDLLVFAGLFFPCLLLGEALVRAFSALFHTHVAARAAAPLAAQFLGYLFWFGALWLILRIVHGEPFWRSLAWKSFQMKPTLAILLGVLSRMAWPCWARRSGRRRRRTP